MSCLRRILQLDVTLLCDPVGDRWGLLSDDEMQQRQRTLSAASSEGDS
jgi:hypothetical protein